LSLSIERLGLKAQEDVLPRLFEICSLLVKRGANINAIDKENNSHMAIYLICCTRKQAFDILKLMVCSVLIIIFNDLDSSWFKPRVSSNSS